MTQGTVFDIEHYAVHDGPGIRTVVFLKGCPLSCSWCCNPESQDPRPELRHTAARCRSCGGCVPACPASAVGTGPGAPRFDRTACSACDSWACVQACDAGALARVGERMTADAVMARVLADREFYANSGGGATFSGGEPLAQPEFLGELLRRCREAGVTTAVETCGHAPETVVGALEPWVDLFLYDLKAVDPERHRALTGCGNERVLSNLRALARRCPEKVTVRVPLVPGLTDDATNLDAIGRLLAELGLLRVELEPYHALGMDKYAAFGRAYTCPAGAASLAPEEARPAAERLGRHGLVCEIAGA